MMHYEDGCQVAFFVDRTVRFILFAGVVVMVFSIEPFWKQNCIDS